ncbi:MAG: glycosyltransferase [Gemmatimonadales bacterium]
MRILHLSKFYPPATGGLEQVVEMQARGAALAGHEVTVVCGTSRDKDDHPGSEVREGVTVCRLPTPAVLWSQPLIRGYFKSAAARTDVVHVHHPHPLADLAVLGRVRAPFVITHHSDIQRQRIVRPLYRPVVRAVLRGGRRLTANRPAA